MINILPYYTLFHWCGFMYFRLLPCHLSLYYSHSLSRCVCKQCLDSICHCRDDITVICYCLRCQSNKLRRNDVWTSLSLPLKVKQTPNLSLERNQPICTVCFLPLLFLVIKQCSSQKLWIIIETSHCWNSCSHPPIGLT